MSISLTKLASAEYYLKDLADIIDEDKQIGADPVAYYARAGNPPGEWIGTGSEILGYEKDSPADPEHVRSIINKSRDPKTGRLLGDPDSILNTSGDPVGGWDLTMSPPKSLSVIWALSDDETRHRIEECMQEARDLTLKRIEAEGITTRTGAGGVASVRCDGVIGFDFRHWTNRDGGPHIHDHLVISNRVRRSSDHQYTAIDGRILYRNTVEYSELYNNLLMDVTTRRLGWNWVEKVEARNTRAITYEVDGVDPRLIKLFSSRRFEIKSEVENRINQEEMAVGHPLDWQRKKQIDLEVWEETRKAKPDTADSLSDLHRRWEDQARQACPDLDIDRILWDIGNRQGQILHVDGQTRQEIGDLLLDQMFRTQQTVKVLIDDKSWTEAVDTAQMADRLAEYMSHRRTTWSRSNIRAEAARITRGFRVDPEQRDILIDRIADHVIERCVKLTPTRYEVPEDAADDPRLTSVDGRSAFDQPALDRYTTQDVLDMEHRIMRALDMPAACGFPPGEGRAFLDRYRGKGGLLADDQYEAAAYALENPYAVSSIIGPAGTGKTTTMKAVTQAWRERYGEDSVIGVALSNRAKDELADSIGGHAVTVSALLHYNDPETRQKERDERDELRRIIHSPFSKPWEIRRASRRLSWNLARRSTYEIRPNMQVVVDEAGMVGTRDLDAIMKLAVDAGAKIILTGDPEQLDTPSGAGGILASIERKGGRYSRQLTSIWRFAGATYAQDPGRFRARWARDDPEKAAKRQWVDEGTATLGLREGGSRDDQDSVERCSKLADEYMEHDRLHWGEDQDLEKEAYDTVLEWIEQDKSVLLLTGDNDQCKDLNRRFLLDRQTNGLSDPDPHHRIILSDELDVGIGDQIICRGNDYKVKSDDGKEHVQNGMVMRITGFGRKYVHLTATKDGRTWSIPYDYMREAGETGYAVTVHRAQGATVDRAYTFLNSDCDIPCNLQYVAMTRGREENHAGYACPRQDQLEDDHLVKGTTTDPKNYARGRFIAALCNHPDNRTALETWEDEYKDRYDIRRLIDEHTHLGGVIAHSHLVDTLKRHHDPKLVERVRKSPNFEWLSATWSRAFMADPRRAMAIISRPVKPDGDTATTKPVKETTGEKDGNADKPKRKRREDPAALLAARLNTGLLNRRNCVIHDDWVAGVIPPVRTRIHDARWELLQQNERMLERQSRILERNLTDRHPEWLDRILPLAADDPNLIRDIAVYRARWNIPDDGTPLGPRPTGSHGLQEQQWIQIADRIGDNGPGIVTPPDDPFAGEPIPMPEEEPVDADYLDIDNIEPPENPDDVDMSETPYDIPQEGPTPWDNHQTRESNSSNTPAAG